MPIAPDEATNALVMQFVAEIILATEDTQSDAAYQAALQTYIDALNEWVNWDDCPRLPHQMTKIFDTLDLDENSGQITAVLTPEGLALFRAWLRRRGIDPTQNMS